MTKSTGVGRSKPGNSNPAYLHGHTTGGFSRTYHSWSSMVQRCTNPKRPYWKHYGGRGITVCKRWLKFENFLADMGERPEGKTLDRTNTNGNYTPKNCRWATLSQQQGNRRLVEAVRIPAIKKACRTPKTTVELQTILGGIHAECVKKLVRKLRAAGVVKTQLVRTGTRGRTLLITTRRDDGHNDCREQAGADRRHPGGVTRHVRAGQTQPV